MDINLDGAQEVQANWFKFEKVGDGIKGTLIGKKYSEGDGEFGPQWVYEIETEEGEVYNVPVGANKKGTVQRLNNCKMGEIIAIVFEKEGEAPKKGFANPKYYKVYSFGINENFNEEDVNVEDIPL